MKTCSQCFTNRNSKGWRIGELAEDGKSKSEIFDIFAPLVRDQVEPFIFKANKDQFGNALPYRQPKPMSDQIQELKYTIGRVFHKMELTISADWDSPMIEDVPVPVIDSPKPVASGKNSLRDELDYFKRRVREIRAFMKLREEMSDAILDSIGMRPVEAANRLIPAGIAADALLDSMTISWPEDTRRSAGISAYDFVSLSRRLSAERGINPGDLDPQGFPYHRLFGYVVTLMENRQPVFLVGPMGTGKSFILKQASRYLGLSYGEASMSGATRGDLLGKQTVNPDKPFIISHLNTAYQFGGLFNFEEMDSAVPEVLNVLNNAIANDQFYNTANGEVFDKHVDFIVGACGNTWGNGATAIYNARDKQDGAALDRFRMGRLLVELDEAVEDAILYQGLNF